MVMDLLFVPVKVVVLTESKTVAVDGCLVITSIAIVGKLGCDFIAVITDDDVVVKHGGTEQCRRFGKFSIRIVKELNQFFL